MVYYKTENEETLKKNCTQGGIINENIVLPKMDISKPEISHEEKETKIVKHFHIILESPIECRDYPKTKLN